MVSKENVSNLSPDTISAGQKVLDYANNNPEVQHAYDYARAKHENQIRKSGEPHFDGHSVILASYYLDRGITDNDSIIAALLHDVSEDCGVPNEEIAKYFGSSVANIVDGVSNLKLEADGTYVKLSDENVHQKIAQMSYVHPRVAILKIFDRLHNMRTIKYLSEDNQKENARETLRFYVPLAEALGMWEIKRELEDISFEIARGYEFATSESEVEDDPRTNHEFQEGVVGSIKDALDRDGIEAEVNVIKNGLWTLFNKRERMMLEGGVVFDGFRHIDDLVSFRITVKPSECYRALGVLHQYFQNRHGYGIENYEMDDYLSVPQNNGYSALQTTLLANVQNGNGAASRLPVEIAISTKDKEIFNNEGVLSVLRSDPDHLVERFAIKLLFSGEHGVYFLPQNAKVIDALYTIYQGLAASADIGLVNGEQTSLHENFPNAAIIQAEFSEPLRRAPDIRWLDQNTLPDTRKMMEMQIMQHKKDQLAEEGKIIIREILEPRGYFDLNDLSQEHIRSLLISTGSSSVNNILLKTATDGAFLQRVGLTLDWLGVTKELLGHTSILLSGENMPGIMATVGDVISQLGANIIAMNYERDGSLFRWRIVTEGLARGDNENIVREELKNIFTTFSLQMV